MNILITQRHTQNKYGGWVDILENNYTVCFESFGFRLIPVSNAIKDLSDYLNSFDFSGIVLSGGEDLKLDTYGKRSSESKTLTSLRDNLETQLLKISTEKEIPVFGICRGMQIINLYFGGKICKNIHMKQHPPGSEHPIKISNREIQKYIKTNKCITNSHHNQGVLIEGLSKDLKIFALLDGLPIVEGLYSDEYPIAGVQWHPDRPGSSKILDELLIRSFLNKKLFWADK